MKMVAIILGIICCLCVSVHSVAQDPRLFKRYEGIEVKMNATELWAGWIDVIEYVELLIQFLQSRDKQLPFDDYKNVLNIKREQILQYMGDTSTVALLKRMQIADTLFTEINIIEAHMTIAMTEEDRIEFRPLIEHRLARYPSCDFTPVYKPGKISANFKPLGRFPQKDIMTGKNIYLIEPVPSLPVVLMPVSRDMHNRKGS